MDMEKWQQAAAMVVVWLLVAALAIGVVWLGKAVL